jgi:hypothetical protein
VKSGHVFLSALLTVSGLGPHQLCRDRALYPGGGMLSLRQCMCTETLFHFFMQDNEPEKFTILVLFTKKLIGCDNNRDVLKRINREM